MERDGGMIRLFTSDGLRVHDEVFLEAGVWDALVRYEERTDPFRGGSVTTMRTEGPPWHRIFCEWPQGYISTLDEDFQREFPRLVEKWGPPAKVEFRAGDEGWVEDTGESDE